MPYATSSLKAVSKKKYFETIILLLMSLFVIPFLARGIPTSTRETAVAVTAVLVLCFLGWSNISSFLACDGIQIECLVPGKSRVDFQVSPKKGYNILVLFSHSIGSFGGRLSVTDGSGLVLTESILASPNQRSKRFGFPPSSSRGAWEVLLKLPKVPTPRIQVNIEITETVNDAATRRWRKISDVALMDVVLLRRLL